MMKQKGGKFEWLFSAEHEKKWAIKSANTEELDEKKTELMKKLEFLRIFLYVL